MTCCVRVMQEQCGSISMQELIIRTSLRGFLKIMMSRVMVSVNYAPHDSQCYVHLPITELARKSVLFRDMLSPAVYERNGSEVQSGGMYLDLPAWGFHVLKVGS